MVQLNPLNSEQQILTEIQETKKRQEAARLQATKLEKPVVKKPIVPVNQNSDKREKRFLERDIFLTDDGVVLKHRLPFLSYFFALVYFALAVIFALRFVKYNQYYNDFLSVIDKVGLSSTFNISFVSITGALTCLLMVWSLLSGRRVMRKIAVFIALIVFGFEAFLAINSFGDLKSMFAGTVNPLIRILDYVILTPYVFMFVLPITTIFFLQAKDVTRYYR